MVTIKNLSAFLCAIIAVQLLAIAGCHRGYYRHQADAEARRLILQKSCDPRWDGAKGNVEIDPQSRMFDPFCPDHPPLPPDDATSHQLMHCVDCKEGYPCWHANGDTPYVESPVWESYLPLNEDGQAVLTLSSAYQLALIHSPELQQQRETLYLSALDVSLQRFGFDSQVFAGFNSFLTTNGRLRNGTGRSSTVLSNNLGVNSGGITATRLGATGTQFAVGLANTILFNFAGNDTQSANSLIDFSIIQPLLRGAGQERILAALTQSERTLLANVRQLERFRRGFYLQIATGRSSGQGPSLNSDTFLGQPSSTTANIGGYMGLLLQQQQIRNQEFNLRQLEPLLDQFRELFIRDRISSLQVAQFESTVYQQQQSLLNLRVSYQNSLDQFKVTLGLPPSLPVMIDDPFLDRFNVISDEIGDRLALLGDLRSLAGTAIDDLAQTVPALADLPTEEDAKYEFSEELTAALDDLLPFVKRAREQIRLIQSDDVPIVLADIEAMESVRDERLEYLRELRKAIAEGRIESEVESNVFETESIPIADNLRFTLDGDDNPLAFTKQLASQEKRLDELIEQIETFEEFSKEGIFTTRDMLNNDLVKQTPDLLNEIGGVVLEMLLLQASARSNAIEIDAVEINDVEAIATARCLRRDWMNARAALVDNWRAIEFFADQLESQLDLVFSGEVGNVGDNPFDLRFDTGQLRAGVRFDAPIVRLQERNDYRQALINYQQARRSFYRFEDEISRSLRQTIRNINQDKILFELNRRSIEVSIRAVELSRADLTEVPRAGQSSTLSDTTARDLTQAINGLTSVQNQYLNAWVEYEVLRRGLDFDLGTMELDQFGEWVDPGVIDVSIGPRTVARLGIEPDCRFCQELGVPYTPPSNGRSPYEDSVDEETTLRSPDDPPESDDEPASDVDTMDADGDLVSENDRKDAADQSELRSERMRSPEPDVESQTIPEIEATPEIEAIREMQIDQQPDLIEPTVDPAGNESGRLQLDSRPVVDATEFQSLPFALPERVAPPTPVARLQPIATRPQRTGFLRPLSRPATQSR